MFLFGFIVMLALAVYMVINMPDAQDAAANSMEDFSFPTNSNGRAVPEVFGTQEVRGNIIYFGDMRTKTIKS
jgi:hypothetical protein